MSHNDGKFHALIEEDEQLKIVLSSGSIFQVGKLPRWFKKLVKVETNDMGFHQRWLDHIGRLKGQDVFISQPYNINSEDMIHITTLSQKYHLHPQISGKSSWYPGRTASVMLWPTDETYKLLRLKKPIEKEDAA